VNQFLESAGIALQAIWANKLRSFLTVLGNIVAVTSIIAVVSLIQGLNATVEDAIVSEVGADTFMVDRFPVTQSQEEEDAVRGNPRVTLADAEAIRKFATNTVDSVMVQARGGAEMKYRSEQLDSVQIQGVTREYASLPTTNVEFGRVITPAEFDAGRLVTILGYDAADRLFGSVEPIDKKVSIAGLPFTVVGVAEKKGSIFGQSQDEYAIIPLPAFQRLFGSRRSFNLVVRPKDPSLTRAAMDETTVALRIERRLKPAERDNFGVFSSDTFLKIYDQATQGIFAVLVGVVGLSLVVGGIVIMNIMLMVVTERTREIGLRKALGARRRDIVWQILTESITLSTFGGVVGTGIGFLLAMLIAAVSPLPAAVEIWSIVVGIGITAVVGLFFGLYPAMQAAALDPIEALRRE
jgi:putative ABC transport system permease protein